MGYIIHSSQESPIIYLNREEDKDRNQVGFYFFQKG